MNETPRPVPPHFVPTLTEVVQPDPVAIPMTLPAEFVSLLEGWPEARNTAQSPAMLERILLRVELSLASRLQETVDSVVEAQMRSFKSALRAQLSALVMDAVKQAVMQETAAPQPDAPKR